MDAAFHCAFTFLISARNGKGTRIKLMRIFAIFNQNGRNQRRKACIPLTILCGFSQFHL